MRTPVQFQQNYPRELAISEAAALAGVDAIQFRIDNTKEERAVGVLKAAREASGWDTRPSPRSECRFHRFDARARPRSLAHAARRNLLGLRLPRRRHSRHWRDCGRESAPWPSIPAVVVNPAQLKRQVEGGSVMGVSIALLEELTFDESGITQDDWLSYPILTMADIPEIKVELIHNPGVGKYGGGSEAANALAAPAIAAAFHDATGKILRRLPLKPAYVQAAFKA